MKLHYALKILDFLALGICFVSHNTKQKKTKKQNNKNQKQQNNKKQHNALSGLDDAQLADQER